MATAVQTPVKQTPVKRQRDVGRIVRFVVLLVFALIVIAPMIYMVFTSFRSDVDITNYPGSILPHNWSTIEYHDVFTTKESRIGRWFFNSGLVVVLGTLLVLLVCSMCAYALARLSFPGRTALFYLILGSMLIPGVVLVIPLYAEFAKLGDFMGWAGLNTYFPLFLVYASGPFGVFMLRQFYLGIPKDLEEAAVIDGAGKFRRWAQIILPLTRTPLLTLGILTAIGIYNDFFWPLVVTASNDNLRTITVGITLATQQQGGHTTSAGLTMAYATLAAIPTVFLFLILQRYFVASSALSGVKG